MNKLVTVIFFVTILTFTGCTESNESKPIEFSIKLNGQKISLGDPKVLIKIYNGSPYTQEITGEIIKEETVQKNFTITYSGDLKSNYRAIAGLYYENDYQDAWDCFCPDDLNISITEISDKEASGSIADFTLEGAGGSIDVSEAYFKNLPIEVQYF